MPRGWTELRRDINIGMSLVLHDFPAFLHVTPDKEERAADNAHETEADSRIEGRADALELRLGGIGDALDDVALNGAGDTERDGDEVVDDCVDEGHGETLVLGRHVVGENDRGGGERHVHSKGHDDDGDEGLRPVDLMDGLGSGDDDADTEGTHGDEHDEADRRVREHEARQSCGQQTADDSRSVLRGHGQRRVVPDRLEEAEHVEDPDAEGAPAETHAC